MVPHESGKERYELVTTLGKGGMAEVYLGYMHSVGGLSRRVAIKRILPDLAQKQSQLFKDMFVDEARLAFQLEHDNIVRVYDVGQSANTYFIVMEYVQGMDLKGVFTKLQKAGQMMPISDCLYIGTQVAAGIGYAHALTDESGAAMGLVHNDISPPNIMIGRYGEVKVADFGLSDARSNDVATPDGMVKGKFAYISPESTVDPSKVTYLSDIFSTGIVLWELIAGRRLFQRQTDIDTFRAVQNCEVPDLRKVRKDVPPLLAQVVNKALAKDPAQRYQSAQHLCNDLIRVSYEYGIPLSRFSLSNLVANLRGGAWDFEGKRMTGTEAQNVLDELGSLFPPGVADHLKGFVTSATVADEDPMFADSAGGFGASDWIDDVIDEAGLADDVTAAADTEIAEETSKLAQAPIAMTHSAPPTPMPSPLPLEPSRLATQIQSKQTKQRNTYAVIGVLIGLCLGLIAGIGIAMAMQGGG